jgi:hypothetical protein
MSDWLSNRFPSQFAIGRTDLGSSIHLVGSVFQTARADLVLPVGPFTNVHANTWIGKDPQASTNDTTFQLVDRCDAGGVLCILRHILILASSV